MIINDEKIDEINIDVLPGIRKILLVDEVVSTQDMARELSDESDMENCLIIAETQSQGKGRMGSEWSSERGGIYMTLVLKPKVACRFLKDLSLFSGKIISDALASFYEIKTKVKKPNDVLAYHPKRKKFLKIAGVLTVSALANEKSNLILIGIGININNKLPRSLASTGVSVKGIKGRFSDRNKFLKYFFEMFWKEYSKWQAGSEVKSA